MEFKNKTIAEKLQQKKRVAKIQDRVLIVDFVGEAKVAKGSDDNTQKGNHWVSRNALSVAEIML